MTLVNFIFGFLPSFCWLFFYLKEDIRPEPKKLLLIVFVLGFLSTLPALFFEFLALHFFSHLSFQESVLNFLKFFFAVALVEEFFKFFAVAISVFDWKEFDEPVDGMIYMITSGLGFAAAENILVFLKIASFVEILEVSALRFLGATLIHALSCGILGYFLGRYRFGTKEKKQILFGLILATTLHAFYNFSIILIGKVYQIVFPIFVLIFGFLIVSFFFKRLKEKIKK